MAKTAIAEAYRVRAHPAFLACRGCAHPPRRRNPPRRKPAMDLTVVPRPATMPATRPLAGRAAIVTGSTSGIGLGIAKALADAGADVMLNGFGDAGAISRLRDELEVEFGVTVAHSAADMSRPEE